MPPETSPSCILVLTQGRLESIQQDGSRSFLESTFANEMIARQERHSQINSWKHDSGGGAGPFNRGALWGGSGSSGPLHPAHFLSAAPGFAAGEYFYTLSVSLVTALLHRGGTDGRERRILHRTEFRESGFCCDPASGRMVMSLHVADGSAQLVLCDKEAVIRKDLTAGDSIDAQPSFSRTNPDLVLFHSSGLARGPHGHVVAVGPSSIQSLNLKSMDHQVVAEAPGFDLLLPLQTADGTLWYIKRPWKSTLGGGPVQMLLDVVLFPWRIGKAIFGFLDAFTQLFGKDRLRHAGGGDSEANAETMRALFLGQPVKASRGQGKGTIVRPPADWLLVKRSSDGREEVVAKNAGWISLWNGEVLWSDGQSIRRIDGQILYQPKKGWIERFWAL